MERGAGGGWDRGGEFGIWYVTDLEWALRCYVAAWLTCRTGGEPYIVRLISSNILSSITASLNPATSPPKLILSSLRTLNTMLDTYIQPTATSDPAATILDALYTPEVLHHLHSILHQTSWDSIAQMQIALTASLISKSCGRQTQLSGNKACERTARNQDLLVDVGVLDALATRMASFCATQRAKQVRDGGALPPQAPPNASLAPILQGIAAIIQDSQLHAIEFVFAKPLEVLFPYSAHEKGPSKVASSYSPWATTSFGSSQSAQQIISPSAFPPLSAALSSATSTHFPPLSPTSQLYHSQTASRDHGIQDAGAILLGTIIGGEGSESGADTPVRHSRAADDDEEAQQTITTNKKAPDTRDKEPKLDVEESELIPWLISQVRSGDSITRLSAASVLTNLAQAGLVGDHRVSDLALLVVPILVQMLDKDAKGSSKNAGYGTAGVGGIDAQTWNRWQIEENAPAVLSRLVKNDDALTKAAIDSGAVKLLADLLKRACRTPSEADDPTNTPIFSHRMRVKDASMRCLVNLGLHEEEYRKKIIDANVITTIVTSCLKPMTPLPSPSDLPNSEPNPPNVLIAACNVTRAVSRSVSILRTSLIDAGIAIPIFSLLHHDDIDVRTAATGAVCNLVLDFSPMRKPILDAGALDLLCELAKAPYFPLKLNSLWALRHLVLDADAAIKRHCFEGLGTDYLMSLITVPTSVADDDETMSDASVFSSSAPPPAHFPPRAVAAIREIHRKQKTETEQRLRNQSITLKASALEFLRNMICGPDVPGLIDHIWSQISADTLLDIIEETIAEAATQPGEIVSAAVYLLCHLAVGAPRHRNRVIGREKLMVELLGLWDHRVPEIRSGLAWVLINLTWLEPGDEAEGVRQRVALLKRLGWPEKLREMRKDAELDVRERVKTVEHQMGLSSTSGGR